MSIVTVVSFLSCFFIVTYIRWNRIENGIEKFKTSLLVLMIIFLVSAGIESIEIAKYYLNGFHKINTDDISEIVV